jgi:IS1 family transposase
MTYYGKQNHKCKKCARQFVEPAPREVLDLEQTVHHLLLERISLRGICRTVGKSLGWRMHYLQELFAELPRQLPIHLPQESEVDLWCLEADEMWTFVGKKANKQWIWLALERETRQIVGYWVGSRDEEGAWGLWYSIPKAIRERAHFYTDDWDAYGCVIDQEQLTQSKKEGKTNHQERFNNTLRQRCSRLVRKALSFSKNLDNHINAVYYFLVDYNLTKIASLHL